MFVYATCVTGLIGEDLDAVCRELSAELWLPVIPVHAPGFVGPKNLGNRIAGETLLEHVIGTAEPAVTTPIDITLIGEYNVAGDLDLVEPLLRECGIRVLSHITGNARFEEIRYAHRAKLSVLVCSRALVNVAAGLHEALGHAERRGVVLRRDRDRPLASHDRRGARGRLTRGGRCRPRASRRSSPRTRPRLPRRSQPYVEVLRGQRAVLYSGGVKSWSMASALRDLGIEILAVGTKKSSRRGRGEGAAAFSAPMSASSRTSHLPSFAASSPRRARHCSSPAVATATSPPRKAGRSST